MLSRPDLPPLLARLADRNGVATWYADQTGRPQPVPESTVERVLDALGALRATAAPPEPEFAPPVVVARAGTTTLVTLHPRTEQPPVHAELVLDSGAVRPVPTRAGGTGTTAVITNGLPVGWHELHVRAGSATVRVPVGVAPYRLAQPRRGWGWSVQLYATRSARGWGVGDLADLRRLAGQPGQGADFLLVNPLHAAAPLLPMQPSPYTPSSRRFVHPLYVRAEETAAYRDAPARVRAEVDRLRPAVDPARIDRDRTWAALEPALRLLWRESRGNVSAYAAAHPGVVEFATWCAIAAGHGPDYRRWPAGLRRPDAPAVAAYRQAHRDEVDFHVWCQSLAESQLAAAQQAAREAGMAVGIVHDLAVGVDPGGADAWALQDVLAPGMSVGAPPDEFNQQGQDWGLPPWHPQALRRAAYAPFRDMVRAVLAHAGGIRVDHVLGLFRLWWVPRGESPAAGAYVRYPAEDLLGVLAMEAARAGAVVIGEDLGTVEPRVQGALAARGVLGTSVLWFEREGDRPRPFERWRRDALAAVTTHDLPTAAGFLSLEHVRLRAELGLLRRTPERELASARREREQLVALLEAEGLAAPGAGPEELVAAMHAGLTRTPALLVSAFLPDAVGDLRQPNLPGTVDAYPNWSLPVAEPDGAGGHRPLTLEQLLAHPGVARLARILREGLAGGSDNVPAGEPAAGRDA